MGRIITLITDFGLKDEYAGCFEAAYELQCEQYYLTPVSSTFHGWDIMAPVAAQLAAGLEPAGVGPPVLRSSLVALEIASASVDQVTGKITGQVIAVDSFGNLETSIEAAKVKHFQNDKTGPVVVTIKNKTIVGIKKAYAQMNHEELLAVINSRGFLEIAVNQGNAAVSLGADIGDAVVVEVKKM